MRGGTAFKVIAVVVVLLLTGGSAWAGETWQQFSVSRSDFTHARSEALRQLQTYSGHGLQAQAVKSFRTSIESVGEPPASSPADWPQAIGRYNKATHKLTAITVSLRSEMRRETSAARTKTGSALRRLAKSIIVARRYQVHTAAATVALANLRTAAKRAATPTEYSSVSHKTAVAAAALEKLAAPNENFVNSLLAATGSSQPSIVSRARSAVSSIDSRLGLLALFTARSGAYNSQAGQDLNEIASAPNAFQAAVDDYSLNALQDTVNADFNRTVPSKVIVVSTEKQDVTLYQNGQAIYNGVVTTGGPELPTYHGVYHIYEKISPFVFHSPFPITSPYYYSPSPVTYWMPFDGGQGLHDAPWRSNFGPGSNYEPTDLGGGRSILGTHGCVNLPFATAQFIWNWAPLGTTVVVI